MYFHELLGKLPQLKSINNQKHTHLKIKSPKIDSRSIERGDLFLACQGAQKHGAAFIDKAVQQGAVAVIVEASNSVDPSLLKSCNTVPIFLTQNLTDKLHCIANIFYGNPSLDLPIIGVTGTNGKTSCCYFIAQLYALANYHCPIIGTLGVGQYSQQKKMRNTTSDILTNYQWLQYYANRQAHAIAMEVSSHALIQNRILGLEFATTVFTNLSLEHLDYHGSMQKYFAAKQSLFLNYPSKSSVINCSNKYSTLLLNSIKNKTDIVTYSELVGENQRADFYCESVTVEKAGRFVSLMTPLGKVSVQLCLYSNFSIFNVLAALAVLHARGYDISSLLKQLNKLKEPPGRMQPLQQGKSPLVLIDYAHTPAALHRALLAAKAHCENQLWVVFGCGGDRWQDKRQLMGEVATKLAHRVILTNDNPRSECPMNIVESIQAGCLQGSEVVIKLNRQEAIEYAIQHAHANDVILIAGKGHETEQIIGNNTYSFNDCEEAQRCIRSSYGE